MAALQGYKASVNWAGFASVALTDEVLTDAGDHQTFNISTSSYATKRVWDKTAAFTVQTAPDGATWTTASPTTYTIRYVTGQVHFASPVTGGTPSCRIHAGAYLPINTAANAKLWEVNATAEKYDSTVFAGYLASVVWKTYLPGLLDAQLMVTQWWADNTWLVVLLNTNGPNLVVVSLYTGRNQYERYEGFAQLVQDDVKLAVNALIEEPLTFNILGQLYYFAGQYS